MDKLAVLKIQKKREAEARARELGWVDGDVFAPKKYVMTEEEKVNMARDFGYLDAPTACFSIGKTNSAAVWWVWKDPYPEFIPPRALTSMILLHFLKRRVCTPPRALTSVILLHLLKLRLNCLLGFSTRE